MCASAATFPPRCYDGTPDEITEYCKKLISVVGKNNGFMLDGAIGIPDEAKLENVKAMFAAVHRYGRYD